jgi:hypothetical protein
MKNKIGFRWGVWVLGVVFIILLDNCSKKSSTIENPVAQIPEVISVTPSKISQFAAQSGGNCSDGGAPVTSKGVCWSTSPNPTINSPKTNDSSGAGAYTSFIEGLSPNTQYYLRAFATNRLGTGYGEQLMFKTLNIESIFSTKAITLITSKTAHSGGMIKSDGGNPIVSRGICWSTLTNPTVNDNKTVDGDGMGEYSSEITGLSANTKYYVRAYFTNNLGTFYADELNFISGEFYVGQNFGGGLVFYVDETGKHGLIVSSTDQGSAYWGCSGTLIGANDTLIGKGQLNTNLIISSCTENNIAAKICNDLVLNGYDDWFLPSLGEIGLMYPNRSELNLESTNPMTVYCSSSEYNSYRAWAFSFYYGGGSSWQKDAPSRIRAIRSF